MPNIAKAFVVVVIVAVILSPTAKPTAPCQNLALLHQRRDAATIESLELEWTRAFLRGDTEFEECLLTPDFTEIMRMEI